MDFSFHTIGTWYYIITSYIYKHLMNCGTVPERSQLTQDERYILPMYLPVMYMQ